MGKLPDDRRSAVLSLVRAGRGRNQIARETGVSQGTVSSIAKQAGVAIVPAGIDRARLKQLAAAAEAYTSQRRLSLYNRAAERAEEMLARADLSPRDLQSVVTSLAIAHDKYRLELGESTANIAHAHAQFTVIDNGRRYPVLPAGAAAPAGDGQQRPVAHLIGDAAQIDERSHDEHDTGTDDTDGGASGRGDRRAGC